MSQVDPSQVERLGVVGLLTAALLALWRVWTTETLVPGRTHQRLQLAYEKLEEKYELVLAKTYEVEATSKELAAIAKELLLALHDMQSEAEHRSGMAEQTRTVSRTRTKGRE